jgi:hypothetical protein
LNPNLNQTISGVQTYRLKSRIGSPDLSRVERSNVLCPAGPKRQQLNKHLEGLGSPKAKDQSRNTVTMLGMKDPPPVTSSIEPARRLRKQSSAVDLLQRQSSAKSIDFKSTEKKLHSSSSYILCTNKDNSKQASLSGKDIGYVKKSSKPKKIKSPVLLGQSPPLVAQKFGLISSAVKDYLMDDRLKQKKVPIVSSSRPFQFQQGCLEQSLTKPTTIHSHQNIGVAALSPQTRQSKRRERYVLASKLLSGTDLLSNVSMPKVPSKSTRATSPAQPRVSHYL